MISFIFVWVENERKWIQRKEKYIPNHHHSESNPPIYIISTLYHSPSPTPSLHKNHLLTILPWIHLLIIICWPFYHECLGIRFHAVQATIFLNFHLFVCSLLLGIRDSVALPAEIQRLLDTTRRGNSIKDPKVRSFFTKCPSFLYPSRVNGFRMASPFEQYPVHWFNWFVINSLMVQVFFLISNMTWTVEPTTSRL